MLPNRPGGKARPGNRIVGQAVLPSRRPLRCAAGVQPWKMSLPTGNLSSSKPRVFVCVCLISLQQPLAMPRRSIKRPKPLGGKPGLAAAFLLRHRTLKDRGPQTNG
ncbi:hypothetical protein CMEL01_15698 [Colletotrichum melonis]|uniref:Uncharacterized protein n=1 Tax=Colletotrichum melonis TaxID=1209925 RepID=A0AAI9XNW9_9PEZI|nr:hypothetical protein CMEL01_15698 [Colletotrichum melonis]